MSQIHAHHAGHGCQTIVPYSRVFALELQQTDLIAGGKSGRQIELITPSAARISRMYTCGTLTEINRSAKGGGFIRVADPTGVLIIDLKNRTPEIMAVLDSLSTPSFVSVTLTPESDPGSKDAAFRLVLETIHASDRTSRDRWIVRTAHLTLQRLEHLSSCLSSGQGSEDERKVVSRYGTSARQLKFLSGMIEKALSHVLDQTETTGEDAPAPDEESGVNEAGERVMNLIRQHSGPRGVSVQELTGFARTAGIAEPLLMDTIRSLISEDEIYQPSSGFVKIL